MSTWVEVVDTRGKIVDLFDKDGSFANHHVAFYTSKGYVVRTRFYGPYLPNSVEWVTDEIMAEIRRGIECLN